MGYDNEFILQKAVDWSLPRFNRMNQRLTAEGKVKFQFEFEKIASKRVPCKHVCIWTSVSNLSNGEVLRLKLYDLLNF